MTDQPRVSETVHGGDDDGADKTMRAFSLKLNSANNFRRRQNATEFLASLFLKKNAAIFLVLDDAAAITTFQPVALPVRCVCLVWTDNMSPTGLV